MTNNLIFSGDKENLCETAMAGRNPKNLAGLVIVLVRYDFSTEPFSYLPIAPGDYRVMNVSDPDANFSSGWAQYAFVEFGKTDATFKDVLSSEARTSVSGMVAISSVDATSGITSGSFDVTIG